MICILIIIRNIVWQERSGGQRQDKEARSIAAKDEKIEGLEELVQTLRTAAARDKAELEALNEKTFGLESDKVELAQRLRKAEEDRQKALRARDRQELAIFGLETDKVELAQRLRKAEEDRQQALFQAAPLAQDRQELARRLTRAEEDRALLEYYTILCYTMLYYDILFYTILYYTILYYTIL